MTTHAQNTMNASDAVQISYYPGGREEFESTKSRVIAENSGEVSGNIVKETKHGRVIIHELMTRPAQVK